MKIVVDQSRCSGHAQCNAAGLEVYELDERGYCAVTELEVGPELEAQARAGANACPEFAITVS